MENQVQVTNQSLPAREIGVITSEIKDICRQAQSMALMYAVEIGRRLTEAKEVLPHGEWGEWLKNEVEFSQRSANNFMKLFQEYGSSQLSFFSFNLNSQTFANLPYSKALALLAIPEEEREEFAEEVKVDELSVKELQEAIKERDLAKKQLEEISAERDELTKSLRAEQASAKSLAKEAREALNKADEMKEKVSKSEGKLKELRKELKEAKENPTVSDEVLQKIRAESEETVRKELEEASQKAMSEVQEKISAAEQRADAAENAKKEAEGFTEDLRKKLKLANPKVTVFKTLFENLQETYAKLQVMYNEIIDESPELAKGLQAALDSFKDSIK